LINNTAFHKALSLIADIAARSDPFTVLSVPAPNYKPAKHIFRKSPLNGYFCKQFLVNTVLK
jgi:hypothetical protein